MTRSADHGSPSSHAGGERKHSLSHRVAVHRNTAFVIGTVVVHYTDVVTAKTARCRTAMDFGFKLNDSCLGC